MRAVRNGERLRDWRGLRGFDPPLPTVLYERKRVPRQRADVRCDAPSLSTVHRFEQLLDGGLRCHGRALRRVPRRRRMWKDTTEVRRGHRSLRRLSDLRRLQVGRSPPLRYRETRLRRLNSPGRREHSRRFVLSKLFDALLSPYTWAVVLLALALPWRQQPWMSFKRRRILGAIGLGLLVVFALAPVSNGMLYRLEHATTSTYRTEIVYDAIVLLGGVSDDRVLAETGHPSYNGEL